MDLALLVTLGVFAPLLGATIVGLSGRRLGDLVSKSITTGLLFFSCAVAWIVFSQWTSMLDLLEVPLKKAGIGFRRLYGTMTVAARVTCFVLVVEAWECTIRAPLTSSVMLEWYENGIGIWSILRTSSRFLPSSLDFITAMKSFASASLSLKCFCAVCVAQRYVRPTDRIKRHTANSCARLDLFLKSGRRRLASCKTILFVT